ncbi:MAG: hypothetical protein K2N58_09575 [Treponemataceae bacterium]|nr:hypothetical protein [Treponemataceae bacterium]
MKFVFAFFILTFSFFSFAQVAKSSDKKSAQENSAIEENVSNIESGENDSLSKNSAEEKKSFEEKYLLFKTSSQEIRMLETNADIFSASSSAQKNRVLTNISGGELQRRFYDENFRLSKIEYWQIASSSAQSKMRRRKTYAFGADGKISELRENDFDAQTSSITFFNSDGKIRSSRKNILRDGKLDSFEIFTYEYDGEGRVLQEDRKLFQVQGKKQKRVLSQRVVNKYSGEKISETSFYENSALRIRTVYTDSENYVQTTYFDGGFVVRDFYENGVKISATFSNGKGRGAN